MIAIAIVDVLGLTYDGHTLNTRGLGGSESAVILMSRELASLGFNVTVFNNCIDSKSNEGVFDGVEYIDLHNITTCKKVFDVVISSRTVIPFLPKEEWGNFSYNPQNFEHIRKNAKHKVVWMHDTFCTGDHLLEDLVVSGHVDEIFTLSDFHTSYVTTCHHGRRRNFEVLKNKIFMTRNGAVRHIDEVEYKDKDPNLFVYNASVTKGMIPLVTRIWPKVKQLIPTAKLKVIGGYYRFRDGAPPDKQEETFWELYNDPINASRDIEFTGIIKQSEIAGILAQSSFMIFPGAFPETFGISSLESLLYNTPLITTRFGALEETAIDKACYLIDYPIEPNNLFPEINTDIQINRFVDLVVRAYNDRYLHQQKSYYCNIVKGISGWDSVALQWKQHLYTKLNKCLPVGDYKRASLINYRVQKVFGRKFTNNEQVTAPNQHKQQKFVIISPFFNASDYIVKCIESVATQDYDNYQHILINDASTDDSVEKATNFIDELPTHIASKIAIINNTVNRGAVYNQISTIRQLDDADVVMLLDGDDWLVPDNDLFNYYNAIYNEEDVEFTYGSCWSVVDGIPLISQPYPNAVKETRQYRNHKFNWGIPYTHFRTFKKYLINDVSDESFVDANGLWYKAGGDGAVFYSLIEQADPSKIKTIQDVVYVYNDASPINDYKVNGDVQNKNAQHITNNKLTQKTEDASLIKNILIAIPTAKNIEAETFKSIYNLEVPEGYKTTFQYFYGYNIDQIRNLIADWTIKGFDYLLSIDSDIVLPSDALIKMLRVNRDVVSGVYIQRIPGQQIPEIYDFTPNGGTTNIDVSKLNTTEPFEVAGCGFGCALVKSEVFRAVGYPQFEYHSAINHKNTVSEDVDFCTKARNKGFHIFVEPTIRCDHIGSHVFKMQDMQDPTEVRLRQLSNQRLLPQTHVDYLFKLKQEYKFEPKVVYDVGACVLHWTNEAKRVWPNAEFVLFEAMQASEFLFKENNYKYNIGLLSDVSGKEVSFYENTTHPGGNSYYRENPDVNKEAPLYFNETHKKQLVTQSVDDVVAAKNFPLPDLVKMDVQGAEVDILKGMANTLQSCQHLIVELQHVPYNQGAPLKDEAIIAIEGMGFKLVTPLFSRNGNIDGDYHFIRRATS